MRMKKRILLGATLGLGAGFSFSAARSPDVQRPNVVIIYGDDVGFGDVGVYGSELIPTPNIDRLAHEGLRFTDAHSAAATCTPSRFSMLTGVHAFRYNARVLPPDAPLLIPTELLTLPKLFKKAGYHTGVVGKWHLGIGDGKSKVDWNGDVKPGPLEVGFDDSFLLPSTNDRVPCVFLRNHRVVNLDPDDPLYVGSRLKDVRIPGSTQYPDGRKNPEAMTFYRSTHEHNNSVINGIGRIGYQSGGKSALWKEEEIADEFVKEAEAYIVRHKDEPFFLYFASQDIHVPRAPHPRFQGATKLGFRGDAMVAFDWAAGQILNVLEENGLKENTLVIFSSDNGPVYDDGYADGTTVHCSEKEQDRGHDGSGVWRGGKYQIYEGGTRVPLVIRWPGVIQPGVSDAMVNQVDLLASFAELFGIELADGEAVDSRSSLAAFTGKTSKGHEFMIEESFALALRQGNWKYIAPAEPKWPKGRPAIMESLYNLADDPAEQTNLIAGYPEKAQALAQKLKEMEASGGIR
jgi:arylsulfatase A